MAPLPDGTHLILSCEHGGHEVPAAYAAIFAGHEDLLHSHRGWDPGALQLASEMAQAFGVPLYASTTTRLLIDLNRSIGHRRLYSELTRPLSAAQRQDILRSHYRPHRDAVEGEIARCIAAGQRVIHLASHSFTPVLDGVQRRADVGWLYDPRRPSEAALSQRWLAEMHAAAPGLQLRRNYPYQGRGDGLTACMRKRFADAAYVGIETEVNQRFALQGGPAWDGLRADLVASLAQALAAWTQT
jgi:predicted N-formylglutamate amidohydrolase